MYFASDSFALSRSDLRRPFFVAFEPFPLAWVIASKEPATSLKDRLSWKRVVSFFFDSSSSAALPRSPYFT